MRKFDDFAEALSLDVDGARELTTDDYVSEVSGLCMMALAVAPSKAVIADEVVAFSAIATPSRFLAQTVARSRAMDTILGPTLAKRLRLYLYKSSCGEVPRLGPAPGENATDLVTELLETKEAFRRGWAGAQPLLSAIATYGPRSEQALLFFRGGNGLRVANL